MNRALVTWNVALTLLVGYLLYTGVASKPAAPNPAMVKKSGSNSGPFQMAYFEMDSVMANLQIVKEINSEMSKRQDAIKSELERMEKGMQQKLSFYQQQASANSLTPEQSDAASRELQSLEKNMRTRQQTLESEYNNYVLLCKTDVKKKIEEYLKEFNQNSSYNYIFSYEPDLFYYKDSAHNITRVLIDGLNSRHKSLKK